MYIVITKKNKIYVLKLKDYDIDKIETITFFYPKLKPLN